MKSIKYKSGYKYQLISPFSIQTQIFPERNILTHYLILSTEGILHIQIGYCWDGPSGPAIDTKNFMRGSLVHDALYQLMRQGLLDQKWREQADIELRKICREDGMSAIRAQWVYWAVRNFAKRCADTDNQREILTAP